MQIISHRGYWKKLEERNTREAFDRSFSLGFGTETDVRDAGGQLVISHDPAFGNEMTLDELLVLAKPFHVPLALNVKADGLATAIRHTLDRHQYEDWFVFDMSIPDTRGQLAAGNPVYIRMSEFELSPPFGDQVNGVWLDAFESDSWRLRHLAKLLREGRKVCLVSPELHKRPHFPFWNELKNSDFILDKNLMLCTDLPEDAAQQFGVFR